ncbi:nucleotide sugar dehydrogenase [Dasania sp. GY-MA-18]|uniref:Nucleotide sugar dehydrogenase n=1 Tax=Dasania phycosphaerae TaxID=2950436 RepID=A0A9J6RR91_9GAMM|nr:MULTISPECIES: nucleotide sugar dehydrogenase [Dasania]MCR8924098.1 nucleotide sugar dehydrogenase [Dasania sp. GY-MA-18]MCZ0866671.1 nucleotide sugar dehydrogenase [Dasania phycosphaerae]MCZ0870256.1 nucleotide sugar dehydrogenase [Dasania phycosphaerae]
MSHIALPTSPHIAIIGLGYVGLPLAIEFGKQLPCVGFNINPERIAALQSGLDETLEIDPAELAASSQPRLSHQLKDLTACNVYIVAVPTPIDNNKQPNLTPLLEASRLIASVLSAGDVVIYESTVYPGCTEEQCVPLLEQLSQLKLNRDFSVGYSPERINPGDQEHRITNTIKITSGSSPEAASYIDALYRRIVLAGTHLASSIKVAEAAKVIENTQRDVNIGLVNELSIIFKDMNIDTEEVLKAAETKWNFLPFRPGLVGGHCIGVDPYYLVHKAEQNGYHPEIISATRRLNDSMGKRVATDVMRLMTQKRIHIVDANILILGLAFKENCPDLRNTGVADIYNELRSCNAQVDVHDPWVNPEEAQQALNISVTSKLKQQYYDTVIIAVAHEQFKKLDGNKLKQLCKDKHVIFDIKYLLSAKQVDGRL